jgi:hypothetical protein
VDELFQALAGVKVRFCIGVGEEFTGISLGFRIIHGYPLVNIQKTMENHHFQWENPLLMAIFNSYVSLPEGRV